jgi:hypothetical protein
MRYSMITLLLMFIVTYNIHAADMFSNDALLLRLLQENARTTSMEANCQTPLMGSSGRPTELKHATMMEKMTYEEMRSASQEKERESLRNLRLSTLSASELQALKNTIPTKQASAQSAWQEKFDEYCCQATCAAGGTTSTGMLLGCFSPQILGLSIGPIKGCCLGGLASMPICVCLLCYYTQTHDAELNEIAQESKNIDAAIKAREMSE